MFDGWGTALIEFLIGLFRTNGAGHGHHRNGTVRQKQKAGKNAKQRQEVKSSNKKNVSQSQKAGDNSEQNQIA